MANMRTIPQALLNLIPLNQDERDLKKDLEKIFSESTSLKSPIEDKIVIRAHRPYSKAINLVLDAEDPTPNLPRSPKIRK